MLLILIFSQPRQFPEISRTEHAPGGTGDHKGFIHQPTTVLFIEFLQYIHRKSSAPAASSTGVDDEQDGFFFFLFFLPVFKDPQHAAFICRHFFGRTHCQQMSLVIYAGRVRPIGIIQSIGFIGRVDDLILV